MNRIIGRYEEVSLQSVTNNAYEYYIPLAVNTMGYDELITNRDLFQTQINAWVDQLSSSTNSTEINNITQIIAIQSERLAKYDELINNYSTQNPPDPINNNPPPVPGTTKKTNWGFIMLLAGIAAIYFLNKKKKAA